MARGDSILWEEGFGSADPEKNIPVTVNTPFNLASVTKVITATALMVLREQGRLGLDQPANAFLRTSKLWSPRWNTDSATVRRLATHRAGITTFDLDCPTSAPNCPFPSMDDLIRRYGVLSRPPGEYFDYSNLGYNILVLANKGVSFARDVVDAAIADVLPQYATLMKAAQQVPPSSGAVPVPTVLDSSFVGAWSGEVLTESGELKMQLTVSDSGTVRATLSSRAGESTGRARFAGRLFRLNITGDLSTADSTRGQRLSFYLRPGAGVMNGAVTLGAGTGVLSGLEGRVSYWVELRRPR